MNLQWICLSGFAKIALEAWADGKITETYIKYNLVCQLCVNTAKILNISQ